MGLARVFLAASGFHGAMAVALGAYAAHGMASSFGPEAVDWTRTGAFYQLVHAVALLPVSVLHERLTNGTAARAAAFAGWAFAIGPMLFAGALYGLAFWGWRAAAMAPPVGGALLILGWLALVVMGLVRRPG